jgi:hypothetical protein
VTLLPLRLADLAMAQNGRTAVYNNGHWTH